VMTNKRFKLRHALVAAGVSAAAALMTMVPGTALAQATAPGVSPAQAASLGAYKAAHDTDPHFADSSKSGGLLRTSTQSSRGMMSPSFSYSLPAQYLIGKNQQGQQRTYWCGPAAVAEAMGLLGINYSQSTEASVMNTTTNGTAWSGSNANVPASFLTGHPVRDTIDYQVYANQGYDPAYAVASVPYTPTQTDTNNYISRMTLDIWALYPVVGDAWEVAGYPHLTGHPTNQTIFHWFTVIGYTNNGADTSYEDSATSVWPKTVPAYTMSFPSSTLVLILGGRGYVW
jgi:hypothetical protein